MIPVTTHKTTDRMLNSVCLSRTGYLQATEVAFSVAVALSVDGEQSSTP